MLCIWNSRSKVRVRYFEAKEQESFCCSSTKEFKKNKQVKDDIKRGLTAEKKE